MGRKSTKENKSIWQTTREDLGLTRESGLLLRMRDCLAHEDLGPKKEYFAAVVPGHGCRVFRCGLAEG